MRLGGLVIPRRTLECAIVVLSSILVGVACAGSAKPVTIEHWTYKGVSFSYPSTLAPGTLELTKAAAQTGCICHSVLPPSGTPLKELHSETWQYAGDKHSGVAISIVDTTNDAADLGTATDGVIRAEAAASLASQLGLPVDPTSIAPYAAKTATVGQHPATYLVAQDVTADNAPSVSEETWLIYRPEPHRLYVLTCQYTSGHRAAMKKACQAIVDSLAVE